VWVGSIQQSSDYLDTVWKPLTHVQGDDRWHYHGAAIFRVERGKCCKTGMSVAVRSL